jgi:hypothetical protein
VPSPWIRFACHSLSGERESERRVSESRKPVEGLSRQMALAGLAMLPIALPGAAAAEQDPASVESHADPLIFAPDDVTGNLRAVHLEEEVESVGNVGGIGNFEGGT